MRKGARLLAKPAWAAAFLWLLAGSSVGEEREGRGVKAWTEGRFTIHYRLERAEGGIRAREAKVRVDNRVHYAAAPSERLKAHEDVHRRINAAERERMEKEMGAFRTDSTDMKQAEREFRQRFYRRLRDIDQLHQAWDATHPNP